MAPDYDSLRIEELAQLAVSEGLIDAFRGDGSHCVIESEDDEWHLDDGRARSFLLGMMVDRKRLATTRIRSGRIESNLHSILRRSKPGAPAQAHSRSFSDRAGGSWLL